MEDLYRLLRAGHVQAQGIVDTVTDPLLVLDGSLCVLTASRSFFETFKVDRYETIGRPLYELGNGQWDIPDLRRLLGEVIPKATAVVNYQIEHEFPGLGHRTMLLTARRLHHPDTASHSMLLSIIDATDRHRQEAARDMLFGELKHRMKNLLGVAQALARQSPTAGRTAEEYRDDFLGRFEALVEAQELVFAEQNGGRLRTLLERVLAPYAADPEAVAIEPGADVELDSRTLLSLSLVLHELATNATKHGALSVAGGRVGVAWQVEGGQLRLTWTESGGPQVAPPAKAGYGTNLIETMTTQSLGGRVEQDYAAQGLKAAIVFPLDPTSRPAEGGGPERPGAHLRSVDPMSDDDRGLPASSSR
jgi:two-component sensor histidine kinase